MRIGRIISISNLSVTMLLEKASIGLRDCVWTETGGVRYWLEIAEIKGMLAKAIPFSSIYGLQKGLDVFLEQGGISVESSSDVLGKVLTPYGEYLYGKPPETSHKKNIYSSSAPLSLTKQRGELLWTGIKAIDFFTPLEKGFRIGVLGAHGTGKTTLLTQLLSNLAKTTEDDSVVVKVGGRIREEQELLQIMKKNEIQDRVATIFSQISQPALARSRAIQSGLTVAEGLREEKKKDVFLYIDDFSNMVQANSEISAELEHFLLDGCYSATIVTEIAEVEERMNTTPAGSITSIQGGLLPENSESDVALSNFLRYLDAAIFLNQPMAQKGLFPAVDFTLSFSKNVSMDRVGEHHYKLHQQVVELLSRSEHLENMARILGINQMSEGDHILLLRASKIRHYFLQPTSPIEKEQPVTKIEEILSDVEGILQEEIQWKEQTPQSLREE